LRSRLWKEQVLNILEAIRGEFGKNTNDKMSKSSSTCVQTNHKKEQVFIEFVATQVIFIQLEKKISLSQVVMHPNQKKEQFVNLLDATPMNSMR
jgi:hypothetical protein